MASESRQRKPPSTEQKAPSPQPSSVDDQDEQDVTCRSVIIGLLPCFAGVAGVSIFLWIIGFFLVPHLLTAENLTGGVSNSPNTQHRTSEMCTAVKDTQELIGALKELHDWKGLGLELGLAQKQVDGIAENKDIKEDEHKKRTVLREWFNQDSDRCWEKVVEALLKMKNKSLAKNIIKKQKLTVS